MEQKMHQLLQNCKSIRELKQTHLQILIHGLKDSDFILPRLITLSSSFVSLDYVVHIFHTSFNPNVVSYNTMIKCFIGKNHNAALRVYNRMKASSTISPNSFTFTFLLKCFGSFEALEVGMVIHGDVLKLGLGSSVFVSNTLLDFYAKCSEKLDFACWVFEEMPEKDVVTWNSMIGAYMARGEIDKAIKLFDSMPVRNVVTWNSVIAGLSKAGSMDLARSVFERMPERNEVSWNSMISGYVKVGDVTNAQCIFDQMPVKSVISRTAMISGYTMVGDLKSASCIFHQMPNKNVVSWNAMISGLVHNHMFDQALHVFHRMLADGKCRPDQFTLISMLSACTHLGSLEHGKWVDSYIRKNNIDLSIPLGNALIDMFSKCGDIRSAKAVFDHMGKKCIITWTTIVSGLAVNGQCKEALTIYDKMCIEGVKPDDVIFIAVFSACTHGGLVEEGKRVYNQMIREFNIKPRIEHYGCMVDLLGRAGRLEEAVRFIESMHLEPNAVIWATLLFACKLHGNGDLLESVTRKIIDQEPSNPGYFTLISNLSASIGRWKDALSFRTAMREQKIEKVPGCSSIQIANRVHEFLAIDTKHLSFLIGHQIKCLYSALYNFSAEHKKSFDSLMIYSWQKTLAVNEKELWKYFEPRNHVKIVSGKQEGATGMVVKVEGHVLIILSDTTKEHIRVFADDVVESSEVTSGVTRIGEYELHDLVQLDNNSFGVIIRVESEAFQVLKGVPERPEVVLVNLREIKYKIEKKFDGQDHYKNTVSAKDVVRILDGPCKGKQGPVEHIYKGFLFIYDRHHLEHAGFICAKSQSCGVVGGSRANGDRNLCPDEKSVSYSPQSPGRFSRGGPQIPSGGRNRGGRGGHDPLVGKTVKVRQGPYKGYRGRVVDVKGQTVRVELESQMKVVTVDRNQISDNRDTSRYGSGSETPMHPSLTPLHPYMTPMRDPGATPIHDGMRTPMRDRAWNPYTPMSPPRDNWEDANPGSWGTSPQYQPGSPPSRTYEAPTPGSGWVGTPGGSYSDAGTPRDSTPAYANAPSPYLPSTPGGQPMTPNSASYLPGTPGGLPMTPGTGGLDVMSPIGGENEGPWLMPDILVNVRKSGEETVGVIREVLPVCCF